MRILRKRRRIGLALGGGGARGWAHIGVIRALQEAGVAIDAVAGTSMGALVGAALAADRIEPLRQVAVELDWKQVLAHFFELSLPRTGLIDGKRVVDFLKRQIGEPRIESLSLPFAAVATDILTGREVVLRSGPLLDAVRASIAIPGLFTPVTRDGAWLVDGGLVNPLPVSVARSLPADCVIAVDIVRAPLPARAPSSAPPKPSPPEKPPPGKRWPAPRAPSDERPMKKTPNRKTRRSATARRRTRPTRATRAAGTIRGRKKD